MVMTITKAKQRIILPALFSVFIALVPFLGYSQPLSCPPNIDWEFGDFTGWTGLYGGPGNGANAGVLTGAPPYPNNVPQTVMQTPNVGFIGGRHTIMNTAMGTDFYGGFPVVSPNGGTFAVKIGDNLTGNGAERVRFKFTVPPNMNNYAVRFLYAVVVQDPNHAPESQPRFTVTVRDSATNLPFRDGCSDLNFVAANNIPGFLTSPVSAQVRYKPWTPHLLNLSGAAGKTVLIDVATGDCSFGGHFGYGYFDVQGCEQYNVTLLGDSCNLDRGGVSLRGPIGFWKYEWYNSNFTQLVDTGEFVNILPPSTVPQVYKLIATPFASVSSCPDTMETLPLANVNINKIDSTCMMPGQQVILDANIYGGSGPLTYQWSELYPTTLSCTNCPVPTVNITQSNQYMIKVQDTVGCTKSEIMTIGVNENAVNTMDDFVQCRPGYMQLDANATGPAPLTPVSCAAATAPACASPTIITIGTRYREQFGSKEDTTTRNNPFAAQYSSSHMQYILKKEDMHAAGLRYGAITSLGLEVKNPFNASLNTFSISLACTKQTSLGGAFIQNPTLVYTAPGLLSPTAGWNDFTLDQPYNWDQEEDLVVDICMTNAVKDTAPVVIVVNTGSVDALIGWTTANNGNVCANGVTSGIAQYPGRPSTRLGYCKSDDAPFQYYWTPGKFLQDTTIKSPLAFLNNSVTYHVNTIGGSDCPVKDSVNIYVPIHNYDVTPKDTTVCYGEKFKMVAHGDFTKVQWYEDTAVNAPTPTFNPALSLDCDTCRDPIVTLYLNTKYYVVMSDSVNCRDTMMVNAKVKALPIVKIINEDTRIKYGQNLQLLVSGAYHYSWYPISTLTNPNIINPWASPSEPTRYYVHGIAENGCRNIDSVFVDIDYRDNLFIPSAFTPNGDGKNDVFRVANITFQRLMEFRVFNRWGQEIYSTTDHKKGWDGSWRGVPQDMGVYQYLIRVAYPDGLVESYKGNVTLVR
jgi:gliding motility-associated-like protein